MWRAHARKPPPPCWAPVLLPPQTNKNKQVMTKEELEDILHVLGLDYEAEANQIYVFYVLPDGRVDNFSLTVRRGNRMSDTEIVSMMRREYPATRAGEVMKVERPGWQPKGGDEWLDTTDVCRMLKVSDRTLRAWTRKGYLKARHTERKVYYSRSEIDALLEANAIGEDGKFDKTVLEKIGETDDIRAEISGNRRK